MLVLLHVVWTRAVPTPGACSQRTWKHTETWCRWVPEHRRLSLAASAVHHTVGRAGLRSTPPPTSPEEQMCSEWSHQLFSMERNAALRLFLLFSCLGFSASVERMLATVAGSSHVVSDQDSLQRTGRRYDGGVKPKFNVNQVAVAQVVSYNLSRKEHLERASWRPFTHNHNSPLNVTINGIPCILFWAKRIMIKFENHTQLDLTEKTFGVHATVDVGDSNCSEDNAMLSLKFGDIGNLKGLVIRFLLTTSYYQLSVQNWFSLQRLQLLYNHSVQATFNATRIYAPASYSFHCEHVSSLQRYDALLIPSSANDVSKLWEVTFIDFQIQGFNIQEGHFAYAKDCASFFSPAILMGLVMSLILLLVLAYALHMLIHLKSLDRHYECKASPAYFAQMKDSDMGDEKEPLRISGNESYELRSQQFCKIYI
ncbi:V-type proton ATPase subunit S1-like protein isoform X2 [Coturnix japonica]|uniref:ATPase H+ transporting accessory protein 1 like (pseudo n=1 Tax=Coturnix japonica TaxID=93934 RepID=A0A8C2SNN3_COTJA|nr:V-type proton ATPase subunit S1-like protein isoform X2 [Coturnix japonica]